MRFLKDIFYLFFPKICTTCSESLLQSEKIICTACRHDLPIIDFKNYQHNKVSQIFYGRIPVEKAISFFYFRKKGKIKTLIHHLKYKGNQEIGSLIGNWFGVLLKESNQFNDVDYIIPVPLHENKLKKRGYNQLATFGKSLESKLNIPYKKDILIKVSSTKTQTYKSRLERFNDAKTKFKLTDIHFFENKHVLLIDDVITTGATLEACCLELLKTKNIKISIATIAFTE
ncbi:ComF family protein [Lutibacter sp. Hel_I_33_5]|uniref:ComF family protein n=1 Tax=Lutibacter sp. Hel_I_33_5 TaxID=1566289 RepID=UPI0011AA75EA|nr:phosphoribosyltransferase family protein [Lutibacter sp. Hel_I_33_5]TVZ55963.1 ComF family protein [Lutibacter sp. Hel_I_33_5]